MQSDVLPPPLPERHHTGDQSRVCSKRNLSRKTAKIFVCILQACEISNYFRRMNEAKNAKKKRNFAKKSRKFRIFANFFRENHGFEAVFCCFWWIFAKILRFLKFPIFLTKCSHFFREIFPFLIPRNFAFFREKDWSEISQNDFSSSLQTLDQSELDAIIFELKMELAGIELSV